MRVPSMAWALVAVWLGAGSVRAQGVAVMPLEAGGLTPERAALVESHVLQGMAASVSGAIRPPFETGPLGCALPACVARGLNVDLVVHMGVGQDNVLRADLYDASIRSNRLTLEEPLGPDADTAAAAAARLGQRVGATVHSLLAARTNAAPGPQHTPGPQPQQAAPVPMSDPTHPANSDRGDIAWRWLFSTVATLAGAACCSYGVAGLFALVFGYMVANPQTILEGNGCNNLYLLLLSPLMAAGCTLVGCALTTCTVTTPGLFFIKRLQKVFGKRQDLPATAWLLPAGPVRAVAWAEPLE